MTRRRRGGARGAEPLLAEEEQAEERRLGEEGEHALHRQRLADDAAGVAGEARPVGAELELHRDAGDDADGEVEPEDARPEAGDVVVSARRRCAARASLKTTMSSASPIVSWGNR